MTFGNLKQRVYDVLGLTDETTMVESIVNEVAQEVATAAPWRFLREKADQAFTTSVTYYTCGTRVAHVIDLHASDGTPLDIVHQDTFDDLYRSDTSTAAAPSVACIEGHESTGSCAAAFTVWPSPSALSTGTLWFLRRVAWMTTDADVPEIPSQWHPVIEEGSIARYAKHESHPAMEKHEAKFQAYKEEMRRNEPIVNLP